jgi:GH18 family chitinase
MKFVIFNLVYLILLKFNDCLSVNDNNNNETTTTTTVNGRNVSTSSPVPRVLVVTPSPVVAEAGVARAALAAPTSAESNLLQRRVCYFANWAPYRELNPPLYPDDIDPSLCTHIHYAFAKIDPATLALLPTEEHDMNWTERTNMPLYIRLYGLKRRNMALKILLAVGGWSAKSDGFNLATRNAQNRSKFINQTMKLLREWNFDGVDLG